MTYGANYSCKTFSPTTYRLATIHLLQTDRQTTHRAIDALHYSIVVACHFCSNRTTDYRRLNFQPLLIDGL